MRTDLLGDEWDRSAQRTLQRSLFKATQYETPEARAFGLAVAAMVAASPYQVYASIEARMYSLGTALTALGAWLLLRALRSRGGGAWVAYGLSCAALLYTHHYGLFTVAAQFVFLALSAVWLGGLGRRDEARGVLVPAAAVGIAVAVAYLPGIDILRGQTERVRQDYWIRPLSWETVARTFFEFLVPVVDGGPPAGGWAVLVAAAGAAALAGAVGRRGDWLVLASWLLPMLFSAAVSTSTPVWVARYFRFAHLFLLTTVVLAAWRLTRGLPGARAPLMAVLLAGLLAGDVEFWRCRDLAHNPGLRGAAEAILAGRHPGETVVALDLFQYFPAKYYLGRAANVRLLRPGLDTFWGGHLIRPGDLIDPEDLGPALGRGLWIIGRLPDPVAAIPELAGASTVRVRVFSSSESLHKQVYVHHLTSPAGGRPRAEAQPGPPSGTDRGPPRRGTLR